MQQLVRPTSSKSNETNALHHPGNIAACPMMAFCEKITAMHLFT